MFLVWLLIAVFLHFPRVLGSQSLPICSKMPMLSLLYLVIFKEFFPLCVSDSPSPKWE
jgi:hypothetical protein